MQFAVTYAPGVFDFRTHVMGRQSAGIGFLRAALAARPERIWCYAYARQQAQVFADDVYKLTEQRPELRFVSWSEPGRLAEAGLLYRGDPGLEADAWNRRRVASARAWSLCGITHTLASLRSVDAVASIATAPLYPWDAIICTSTVARNIYRTVLDAQMEHLRASVGATRFTLPQLPLIPLGVHPDDFVFSDDTRAQARAALDLGPADVAVLFAGRLSFHGKAHPLPMFLGLEAAARRTGRRVALLLFGQFPNDPIRDIFLKEGGRYAPSVRLVHVDGAQDGNRERAWAAADLFTSLSDNVQETFGLTPIEALAAGLPAVVSDWDGYKDTVRDGIDGFRVPTVTPPSGCGDDLVSRHDLGLDDYDRYVGNIAQLTAVDVGAATEAYARLIASPELRGRMGEAGRRRARDTYDWQLIFRRYTTLWEELAERRRSDPALPDETGPRTRPTRPDPFDLFRSFPTAQAAGGTRLRLREGATLAEALERRGLASVTFATAGVPTPELIQALFPRLSHDWSTFGVLAGTMPGVSHAATVRAAVWLAKAGLVEVQAGRDPAARNA